MAVFNDFLTTEGERLLARSLMGEAQITFTRMEIGDGEQAITNKNITALSNKRMELDIYSVNLSGNVITVTSILDSKDITDGFYFREKGLFATDGTNEILMIYANCGSLADWIDNINVAVFTRQLRSIITFSESDNINITLQDGLYASTNDIHELESNMAEMISDIKLEGDWSTYTQVDGFINLFNQFLGWYTQSRAGKLDNLDALVSSRAPAGTALSNAVWTNARAGYLDYLINGTYGLPAIKAYVDSLESNVGSTADNGGTTTSGTIMAKLNALQAQVDALKSMNGYYKPSNNVRYTFVSSEVSASDPNAALKVGGFYAAKSGCIRVTTQLKISRSGSRACLMVPKYNTGNDGSGNEYIGTPKTTAVNFHSIENNTVSIETITLTNYKSAAMVGNSTDLSYQYKDTTLWVEHGQYVAFYLCVEETDSTAYCNSLKVYYDEVN